MICWWLEEYLFYSEISLSVCFCKVYGIDLPQATHCFCMIFPLPEFYVYSFRYYNQIWQEKVFWRNFKATVNWNKSSKKTTFHEDLIDLQKVQLNAMKESEKRQQDFMETIVKQQQEKESLTWNYYLSLERCYSVTNK